MSGTECARYFEAWLGEQTSEGDEQAKDVSVELTSTSASSDVRANDEM
jgi:hypothetical protein